MARDHYLPAAWIGHFSKEAETGPYRDRRVWVARRGSPDVKVLAARTVGYRKNLYDLKTPIEGLSTADSRWRMYEHRIPEAMRDVEAAADGSRRLPFETWIRVLVPMIAGAFVRGLDYGEVGERNAEARWPEGPPEGVVVDPNMDRLLDHQIVMGLILFARWGLVVSTAEALTLPDIGVVPFVARNGGVGMLFPLTPRVALALSRGPGNMRAIFEDETWEMAGLTKQVDPPTLAALLAAAAGCSRSEVYARSESAARHAAALLERPRTRFMPSPEWLRPLVAYRPEFVGRYFELAGLAARRPASPSEYLYFSGDRYWTRNPRGSDKSPEARRARAEQGEHPPALRPEES